MFQRNELVTLGKAKYLSPGAFTRDLSLEANVRAPYAKGCFIEAIINLDRIIDFQLEMLLAQAYDKPETLEVVNEFKRVFRLTGAKTAEMLSHKKTIPQTLYSKINKFKGIRGILAHDALGEYALLSKEQEAWERIGSQEEFDAESKKKIDEALHLGEEIHAELLEARKKLSA